MKKKHRVANFHQNTLASFTEIVGAMGLSNPSQIKPYLVKRRVDDVTIKTLDEVFTYLEPGALLKDNIPAGFEKIWSAANAQHF